MDTNEALAGMRRNLIDKQTSRLTEAAGRPLDDTTNCAFAEVAAECGPDTIDTLVTLLRRLRAVAPDRVAAYPVVAFTRYGQVEGMLPSRGAAITAEGGRYNVHTVFFDEHTARWEGQNGRYGVPWHAARDEMNRRADLEAQP
jgi:hypothetical protein